MSSSGRPTLRDVARIAGVSHNTVSLVVRESNRVLPETRARVQAVIEHLGYQPHAAAAALRSSRSGAIGYLIHRALGARARPKSTLSATAFGTGSATPLTPAVTSCYMPASQTSGDLALCCRVAGLMAYLLTFLSAMTSLMSSSPVPARRSS